MNKQVLEIEAPGPIGYADTDITGRNHLVRNVLSSWAGHMVFIISGFIMPRLIDRQVGQSGLGVWDFGWSLTGYFGFVQAGIGSSVCRYIAKYRAVNNIDGVCRTISSVICFQGIAAFVVVVLTVMATWLVPFLLSARLGAFITDARWVVMLLGLGVAVQMGFSSFIGVITGCHRWDLHNLLNAGIYAGMVLAWIAGLLMGGGLKSLAIINLAGIVITELVRVVLAFKVCPELRISLTFARWAQVRRMLAFGGKTFLTTFSQALLYQTSNMLVVGYLGPGALAMYCRPGSLIQHALTFVNKYAFVLTPTASCLHACGQKRELAGFLVETTRYGAFIALPIVLFLSIMGSPLLLFWMGPDYTAGWVLAILAVGHLLPMIQQPVWNIMAGMNAHGRIGLANLIGAVVAFVLAVLMMGILDLGLIGAAMAVVIPLTIVYGIYIPFRACRQLDIPVESYLLGMLQKPILCVLPFAICLTGARLIFQTRPIMAILTGGGIGTILLALTYWQYVLPPHIRDRINHYKTKVLGRVLPIGS